MPSSRTIPQQHANHARAMSHAENRADILHQQIAEDRARFARSSSDVRYVIIIIFIVLFII